MKTNKKLLILGATLSLSALLFGCSKEEEAKPKEEPKVEETATSEPAETDAETTTSETTETEATETTSENSELLKETSTIAEADVQNKALELITADYEAFLKSEEERAALAASYHPEFKEADKKVELPKLESNLTGALDGRKINDLEWASVEPSVKQVQKSGEGADYKDMYAVTTTSLLTAKNGEQYYDVRVYYLKEYNNELQVLYIEGTQPAQKL